MKRTILCAVFLAAAMISKSAPAQTLNTLVDFNNGNGAGPLAGLIADADGNLFGTTWGGGAHGAGTVFEIVKTDGVYASTPTILVNFDVNDGNNPYAGLIMDADGNLFGTTAYGGTDPYAGTVFEVVKTNGVYANTPTVLVNFDSNDVSNPYGGLIMDADGNLFGTTSGGGGPYNAGTVFEIVKTNGVYASTPTVLVAFDGNNGAAPYASLIMDANGNLFGTTAYGGEYGEDDGSGGYGTVFEIVKTNGVYASTPTVLVNFDGNTGGQPYAGLIADSNGDLFGTTTCGGAYVCGTGNYGAGTVFEIVKTNGVYASTPTFLVSFDGNTEAYP